MKTTQDQIADLENTRAAKTAEAKEVMQKSLDEGRSTDEAEAEQFDTLQGEIKQVDADLVRLKALADMQASTATPVSGNTTKAAGESRSGHVSIKTGSNLPKGTAFTRYVMAQARAKGNLMQATEIAKQWTDSTPEVELVLRAAVAAGTTTDANWAAPLVQYQDMASEFIDLLRPATIIGNLNLRNVPFNVRIPTQTGGSTVGWVGQTKTKPVSALAFSSQTLDFNKVAGIVVISEELARLSSPSAENVIRSDLIAQTAQFLDEAFIDPSKGANAGVNPASVTNGVTPIPATGTDATHLRADLRSLFAQFIAANMSIGDGVFVMSPSQALAVGMLQNPLGQPEFAGVGANGGTLLGVKVIVSESVPTDSNGSSIILIKQSDILLADDGGVAIDVSNQASLQMDSVPTDPATASTVFTSLWQNNMIGIRAERWITWAKRRTQAVSYISGANYG